MDIPSYLSHKCFCLSLEYIPNSKPFVFFSLLSRLIYTFPSMVHSIYNNKGDIVYIQPNPNFFDKFKSNKVLENGTKLCQIEKLELKESVKWIKDEGILG